MSYARASLFSEHDGDDLPDYAAELRARVHAETVSPLVVAAVDKLTEFDSDLQLAAGSDPVHTLRYAHTLQPFRTHFLVSAATKVHRIFSVPPIARLVPGIPVNGQLPKPYHDELVRKLPRSCPEDIVVKHSSFLRAGLTRQLTSFPLDLRVEEHLHAALPEHREQQEAYLRFQVTDFTPTLQDYVREYVPDDLYVASTAMNLAFAETAARLTGVVPDHVVQSHSSRPTAEQLLHHLDTVATPGYAGDRELTDRWAGELGLRDWYDWVPLTPVGDEHSRYS